MDLPEAEDWTQAQRLAAEKEVLGFYLTSHPLTEFSERLNRLVSHRNRDLGDLEDGEEVTVGGMISAIKKTATKKPNRNGHTRYANFDFEDPSGIVRCIIWPEDFARSEDKVVVNNTCIIRGRVDRRGREPNVIVNQLLTLEEAEKHFTKHLSITFQRGFHTDSDITRTREVLARHPGKTSVFFVVDSIDDKTPGGHLRYFLMPPQTLKVTCSSELTAELTAVVGGDNFRFHANSKTKNGADSH
ncbi:MAG: OB-fold nucleic acid binding domain-containing protein [Planctomycetaceae bacterium]